MTTLVHWGPDSLCGLQSGQSGPKCRGSGLIQCAGQPVASAASFRSRESQGSGLIRCTGQLRVSAASILPNKRDTHPLQFCIEVFAKRAELTAAVRQVLPNSFGVGTGCDAHTPAPVIPIDVLFCSGQALCLSWVREPGCLWVHVRCPRAMFPIGHASHHVECAPGPQAFALIKFLKCLVKHCRDTDTSWSVEAPSRSLLWERCNHVAIGERVQINLRSFGHPYRSPVTIATSRPSAFSALALPCEHDHKSLAREGQHGCMSFGLQQSPGRSHPAQPRCWGARRARAAWGSDSCGLTT